MILDLLFLLFLAYFIFKGYNKGAIVTLISAVASIVGVLVAITFSSTVAAQLFDASDNIIWKKLLPTISYLIVFCATVFLVRMLAKSVKKGIRTLGLGVFDKLVGAVVSGLAIFIISALCVWVFNELGILSESVKTTSKTFVLFINVAPKIIDGCTQIFPFLKNSFQDLKDFMNTIKPAEH